MSASHNRAIAASPVTLVMACGHSVDLRPDCIVIRRVFKGVALRMVLPSHQWRGVALRLAKAGLALDLAHDNADFTIRLGLFHDDREAAFAWRRWTSFFSLPPLVADGEGALVQVDWRKGGLVANLRRRRAMAGKRRSNFSARRKPGAAALTAQS